MSLPRRNQNDESDEDVPSTSEKSKTTVKYDQKYNKAWDTEEKYKGWLTTSSKGCFFAYCKSCAVDIAVKFGKQQLNRHLSTQKHESSCKLLAKQLRLPSCLPSTQHSSKIKDAEIRLAGLVAEHNLPFQIMDYLPSSIRAVCSDSDIARGINSARTKTTAIVKNVLGTESRELLIAQMKKFFSIVVDESTDVSCIKHLCIVVRIVEENFSAIKDYFFALIPVTSGTADALFSLITPEMDNSQIHWKTNLIKSAADGAATMIGTTHSLQTLFKEQIPSIFVTKCVCHSSALCASNACLKLPRGVEDLARNVYNYLSNSPKQQSVFQEYQEFVDVKRHKILHPVQTRWLSLRQVVVRLLEQYEALKFFFIDAVANDRLLAAENILTHCQLTNPQSKLFLQFLSFALPIFNELTVIMQSEEPQIHKLYLRVTTVLKTLLECYLDPNYSRSHAIRDVEHKSPRNFMPLENMYFGADVVSTLAQNSHFDPQMVLSMSTALLGLLHQRCESNFKQNTIERYIIQTIIQNLNFLNPAVVKDTLTVAHIASKFPNIISANELQPLDTEWRILRNTELDFDEAGATNFWLRVSRIKSGDSAKMFPSVGKFYLAMLTLPHSSANVERVFSAINNLKSENRNRLPR